jgi:hypothetical protein
MRSEYDLHGGKRNPYAKRIGEKGRKVVVDHYLKAEGLVRLDEDVAEAFGSDEAVNEALRLVLRLRELTPRPPKKASPTSKPRKRRATSR